MTEGSSLDCSVLVLNRYYMVVRVVDVRRAMTLLYRGCAEVITVEIDQYCSYDFESWVEIGQLHALDKQDGEDYLRTPHYEVQVPRIVRLSRFDKILKSPVRFNRKNLFARDSHRCQYCGVNRPTSQLSLDHVVPRSQDGPTTWENVVCCCLACNSRKGGRTPTQAGMKLLSKPMRPTSNPAIIASINDPRYECWKTFLPAVAAAS